MNPQDTGPINTDAPVAEPSPAVSQAPQPVTGSKALAIWALVIAIIATVIGIFWFVAIPLALVGLILAIVVLVKKKAGKRIGIAALIVASLALLAAPLWILMSLAIYNGVTERANELVQQTQQAEAKADTNKLESDCFNFTAPEGYSVQKNDAEECYVAINTAAGTTETKIEVLGLLSAPQDRATIIDTLKSNAQKNGVTVNDSGTVKTDFDTAYYIKFTEKSGAKGSSYYFIDADKTHSTPKGEPFGMYVVTTYDSNTQLDADAVSVVKSFSLK